MSIPGRSAVEGWRTVKKRRPGWHRGEGPGRPDGQDAVVAQELPARRGHSAPATARIPMLAARGSAARPEEWLGLQTPANLPGFQKKNPKVFHNSKYSHGVKERPPDRDKNHNIAVWSPRPAQDQQRRSPLATGGVPSRATPSGPTVDGGGDGWQVVQAQRRRAAVSVTGVSRGHVGDGDARPAHPAYPRPAHHHPAYPRPAHHQPAYPRPAHHQPTCPRPAYPRPAHHQPAYPRPAHHQPAYPRPAYHQPAYPRPAYPRPAHHQPVYPRPAYHQPAHYQLAHPRPQAQNHNVTLQHLQQRISGRGDATDARSAVGFANHRHQDIGRQASGMPPTSVPPVRRVAPRPQPVPSDQEQATLVAALQAEWRPRELPLLLHRLADAVSALRQAHVDKAALRRLLQRAFTPRLACSLEAALDPASPLWRGPVSRAMFDNLGAVCGALSAACPVFARQHFSGVVCATVRALDATGIAGVAPVRAALRDVYSGLVKTVYQQDGQPPCSFRDMSLVPTAEDFESKEVFLRPNLTEGAYASVDDYLDVQFRLLREDFLKPLRDTVSEMRGLSSAFQRASDTRWNAVRIYNGVHFRKAHDKRYPDCLMMDFDLNHELNIDWAASKRFMKGALLVVSNDGFRTVHLAKVHHRDLDTLHRGSLPVQVLLSDLTRRTLQDGAFTVGECTVFFEPYYQVMRALQNTRADAFPLARYIVHSDAEGTELPDYLKEQQDHRRYDVLLASGAEVSVDVVAGPWPSAEALGLNATQREALVGALTRKVMLVQGPPGTGKTFLGLRVVRTLLRNHAAWSRAGGPILVVCCTNHALDQFLSGLLDTTNSLVRLGGRCKDERLLEFVLEPRGSEHSPASQREFGKLKRAESGARSDLVAVQEALSLLAKPAGVVDANTLSHYRAEGELEVQGYVVDWLTEGLVVPDIGEEERRLLRCGSSLSNACVSFEQTFDGMRASVEELESLVRNGLAQHEARWRYARDRLALLALLVRLTARGAPRSREAEALAAAPGAEERWSLYRQWLSRLEASLKQKELDGERALRQRIDAVEEARMAQQHDVIRDKLVVGMTTTKAAGLHKLLHILKPSIVVVEEAAEVLESHVIAALHPEVQHLLLLGDHKQLRPSVSVHELGLDFQLDVSLFERLCSNGTPCQTLGVQHRMRPEIASLVQFIYPGLENHHSVSRYPGVRGLRDCLFFVDHRQPEKEISELISHSNPHEAHFVGALVRYLKLQGYGDEQITVLTTYSGQIMFLRGLYNTYPALRGVRLSNVDNFQGEECEIVILSLVRSNPQGYIGFLKTQNRVCVALSRAKHALYVVGNMECLASHSDVWRSVRRTLQAHSALGPALALRCERHPDETRFVRDSGQFDSWGVGELCGRRCEYLLNCGHPCPRKCHRDNPQHEAVACVDQCERTCAEGHRCIGLCYQPCGPCQALKDVQLQCGHFAQMPCSKRPETFLCRRKVVKVLAVCGHESEVQCFAEGPCKKACGAILPCRHECDRKCHRMNDPDHLQSVCTQPCRRARPGCVSDHACPGRCGDPCPPCDRPVRRALPCGHTVSQPCAASGQPKCTASCTLTLPCGHRCRRQCGQPCGPCSVQVEKERPACGHRIETHCSADPSVGACPRPCERELACGHACKGPCRLPLPCRPCPVKVLKPRTLCGDMVEVACSEDPDGVPCESRCSERLACGHRCRDRCGRPCQAACSKPVKYTLGTSPCGHTVTVPCHEADRERPASDLLSLCKRPCQARLACGHGCKGSCLECRQGRLHRACDEDCGKALVCGHRCPLKCGRPCLPCKEQCIVTCEHGVKCKELCGRPCTPCLEPCKLGTREKCLKKCREVCSFDPTEKPCCFPVRKCNKLGDDHECLGFDGEPCPPLCPICDRDVLGQFDEHDRFVLLPDCRHVVKAKDVARPVVERPTVIALLVCPLPECRKPTTNCPRYANVTRRGLKHIATIFKEMGFADALKKQLAEELDKLSAKLDDIDPRQKRQSDCLKDMSPATPRLLAELLTVLAQQRNADSVGKARKRPGEDSAARSRSLCAYAALARSLDDCLRSSLGPSTWWRGVAERVDDLAEALLLRDWHALSQQEVLDVNAELGRIRRLQQLCWLEWQASLGGVELRGREYDDVCEALRSCQPYPLRAMDGGVRRAILALSEEAVGKLPAAGSWWRRLDAPLSAAAGQWYVCGEGKHPYTRSRPDRRCPKCV